ncbi:MAG: hypothetical protein ACRCUJ_12860 [Phocaeicola sp.]
MPKICFEQTYIPVPMNILDKVNRFKDGGMSINGVRVVARGMKLHFHVLFWSDLEILVNLKVPVGAYFDYFKAQDEGQGHKFLLNAVKRLQRAVL